ncbi:hypothetical protein [Streptomyces sp. NPDC049916]|uniref:hypothetical protein n=1 Tax=Streptomyces sp. NPDC049916 TaxID=3155156 RepID=UPI003447C2CD
MAPMSTGLHVNAVVLGASHRICAIWKVSGPAGRREGCAFPFALLLRRRGTEQDWAAETALGALAGRRADGPVCVDLTTTVHGIEVGALRPGLCGTDLLEASRTALGEGHREWARRADEDPSAFHAAASGSYVLRRHAAVLAGQGPRGRGGGPVRVVHEREQPVLRAYAAALLARTGTGSAA